MRGTIPAGQGPVLPAVVAGPVLVVSLVDDVVEVALADGAVVVVPGAVVVVLDVFVALLALEGVEVVAVPLRGVIPVEGWIPGEGVMPRLFVSFGVVRAELGETGVEVSLFAVPVVVVAGAGTQSGVAAGVVCVVLVGLVAEAGGMVGSGVAGVICPFEF